jgi:A/G-specific adenine glycosylase
MTDSLADSTPDFPAEALSQSLVRWYRRHRRPLPWRKTRDPYAILVSEFMLQQTTVATVLNYYGRFLRRFPTLADLAAAPEDEVLALWSGLGYYRRARHLRAAARKIVEEHGGCVPRSLGELMALPGIGRYTAGAVLSFAHGEPAPIVEANSARVLARLFGLRKPLKAPQTSRHLWRLADRIMSRTNPRDHNYALMELGSLVCKPRDPDCEICPVSGFCMAFRTGEQHQIPLAAAPVARTCVEFVGIVAVCDGRVLVRRIPEGAWHAGMFEFPKVPVALTSSAGYGRPIARQLLHNLGLRGRLTRNLDFRYTVTRHAVTLRVWLALCEKPCETTREEMRWVPLADVPKLPLGSAQHRVLAWVRKEYRPGGTTR